MSEEISEADVEAVLDKLQDWGNSLPDKERVVLRHILSESIGADEVQGFAFGGPVPGGPAPFAFRPGASSLMGRLGFGNVENDDLYLQITPTRSNQPGAM